MKNTIDKWIGKEVHITLRAAMPVRLKATLMEVNESGVLVKKNLGITFIPATSILHISLLDKK